MATAQVREELRVSSTAITTKALPGGLFGERAFVLNPGETREKGIFGSGLENQNLVAEILAQQERIVLVVPRGALTQSLLSDSVKVGGQRPSVPTHHFNMRGVGTALNAHFASSAHWLKANVCNPADHWAREHWYTLSKWGLSGTSAGTGAGKSFLQSTSRLAAHFPGTLRFLKVAGKVFAITGLVLDIGELGMAVKESYKTKSLTPILKAESDELVSMGTAWAGAKLGAMAGAALGVETGPGAILTAIGGAVIGAAAGYFASNWVNHMIDKKSVQKILHKKIF